MSNDIDIINIVNSIKKISKPKKTNNMIFGEVKKVDPLEIDIGDGVVLSGKFLYLGQMCRPHKVKIPHTHEYNGKTQNAGASSVATDPTLTQKGDLSVTGQATVVEVSGHKHDIKDQVTEDVHKQGSDYEESVTLEIEPKLAVGDIVLMFAMNDNQCYYVAERVEAE